MIDATGATPPAIGVEVATVKLGGDLKNIANTSLPSNAISPPLTGDFGVPLPAGPTISLLVASGTVAGFGTGDTINYGRV